jgi:TldD protein
VALPFNPETAQKVLDVMLSRGGDFAEIFAESGRGTALSYEGQTLEEASTGRDQGVGLRLIHDDTTYFANGNDLSEARLLDLAANLAASLPDGLAAARSRTLGQREVKKISEVLQEPGSAPVERKVELLERADRAARNHDRRVVQVNARYRDAERTILVANSEGLLAGDRMVYTTLFISVVARQGDLIRSAVKSASGTCGLELIESSPPDELGREAARVACLQLEADPAPAGTFTVVLSSRAGGTMVHEACGHGLEGDFIHKGLSVYAGRLGEKVASELATVVDDGTMAGKRGSFGIDDEGTPSQRTVLIENGVLKQFMHSRQTAGWLDQQPTGNGRRQSYRHLPIPRMRNTLIVPGEADPGEIVASVEDGILVTDMGGGEVDIVSGNFVFHCTEAYRIRGGKVAEPLRDAILTGNGPEVLTRIDRVGRDLGYQVGTCGKDGQGVPVADAQPTLRIPGIVVGGQAR